MSDHDDDLSMLSGAYALDALTDAERTDFEAALADSPELRAEAASLSETALLLGYAADPVEPPASMKNDLMAKIATMPQLPPLASDASTDDGLEARPASATDVAPGASPAPAAPSSASHVAVGRASRTAQRRWFQRPAAVLGAAAAAVAIFVGGGLVANGLVGAPVQEQQQAEQATNRTIARISAADDVQRVRTAVDGGTATVIWSDSVGRSAMILDGVASPGKDKTYELWYIGSEASGGKIEAAGLMDGVSGGVHTAVLSGTKQADTTVGMTVEPAGGSKQPTTTPIVAVPTSAS